MLPQGPNAPYLWQVFQVWLDPLEALKSWSRDYGDTFRLGGTTEPPKVSFSSPSAIKTIFTASSSQLSYAQKSKIIEILLGDGSFIFLPEQEHQRQRRLIAPFFYKESLEHCGQQIVVISQQVMHQFGDGKPFKVRSAMKEISLQVLLHIVFGLGDRSRHEKLRYVLTELFTLFESPLLIGNLLAETFSLTFLQQEWGVWGDLRQLQRDLDQIVAAEIEQKRTQKELLGKDLLSLLITACDENGQAMTDQEIRNALMTLIFAGFETAAAAMSWAFYWVNYAPGIREKLINELSSQPSNIEPSVIARLPYLGAVCQETLRINPPTMSAFSRTVNQPVEIDGYRLEPGTEIDVSIYLAHRRGSVYPEPDKFRPERFLERQFSPYEYLPFGGGQCRCLGASLAQYQMKLVLATILKNFRLQLVDPQSVKPVRHGIIMIPEGLMAIVSLPC